MLPRQLTSAWSGNILHLQNFLLRSQRSIRLGRMETEAQTLAQPAEPIKKRIDDLLKQIGQTSGWLADRAGVPRSTVKRILDGDRNPTAETLATLAPILGVTVEELIHGTDAADRIDAARKLVDRTYYEEAVRQFVAMEQRAADLSRRLRTAEEIATNEEKRRKHAENERDTAINERDEARREALGHQHNAERYQAGLEQALTDLGNLKTRAEELRLEVEKLGGQVGSNKTLTAIATSFAAAAAALSLSNYLKDDAKSPNASSSHKKKKRAASA
jgi:transcriptional regulator with XRE-family HTH domain